VTLAGWPEPPQTGLHDAAGSEIQAGRPGNGGRLLCARIDRPLRAAGLAAAELLRTAGLSPQTLDDLDGRVAFSEFKRLCEVAARQLDDPMLGLHLGANLKHAHLARRVLP
jgi:hypothetical protein